MKSEQNDPAVLGPVERPVRPRAWLCELAQEDGTTRTQFVEEDPDGLRWNDAGEPSPYRTTPLYESAEIERGAAAVALLKRIRYHAQRHTLPRDWLTAADEVLGTWGPVKLDHPELKA